MFILTQDVIYHDLTYQKIWNLLYPLVLITFVNVNVNCTGYHKKTFFTYM